MSPQACGQCRHWQLRDSPLRQYGYGKCGANPVAGHTTAPQCICRIGRFEKADAKTIARREKEGAAIL